MWYAIGLTVDI